MLRWILMVGAGIAVLAALVWGVGALLPEEHVASTRAVYGQPPDSLYAAITDVGAHPSWRSDVEDVEILSDDPLRWREAGEHGAIAFLAETVAPPSRFVARIDDPGQPFGGRWSWRIEPADDDGGGSVVTITEEGEIYSPLFRFFARFVFGYHGTQEAYLRALGERFGEETAVERVEAVETGAAPPATERFSRRSTRPAGAGRPTDPNSATRERSMARVTGIGGIFFKADDPDALASWYREHLRVPVDDGTWARFRWLQ
ncbi:MAG: SRPBCC family protein [Gemmatimonadota bacterium]